MTLTPDTQRKQEESIDEYLIRLGSSLSLYDLTWTKVAELMNSQPEIEDDYSESKYRKDYAAYERWNKVITERIVDNDEYLNQIQDASINLQKEKVKFQDQKREFGNIVRQQARFEHLKDEVTKSIRELEQVKPLSFIPYKGETTGVRANTLWSDWHYGADFSNSLNKYSPEIFKSRLEQLISKVIYYGKLHKVDTLTIGALGDFLSGAIHVSTRVQASEDVIKQIQVVSEYLAESVAELSKHFRKIRFINIIGNHARLISNKHESIFTENLERILPWYLESRLRDFKNVDIYSDQDGYFVDDTFNPPHVYVHGDLDHVSSVAKTLPQMLGIVPRYVFCGHIHHDTVKEYGKTKVISNSSLIGVDDYALSKRFFAEPAQKMHIFKSNDKIEHYIEIDFE
ncbi:hypothetical protein A9X05_09260 [Mycobacterium sp. E3298]|nr:hypothetical protein [Mycobacterium sp. E3298]OBG93877.1 hypothetical protein A9X05_09260 [Mycobacterium sp. E3298]